MKLSTFETKQIKSYLDAVGERLSGPERAETLAGLESHIYEAIDARQGAGEQGDLVSAVLAEMDPPDSYTQATTSNGRSGISWLGLIGVCLLPFAGPVFVHVTFLTPLGERSPMPAFFESSIYRYVLLPAGTIGPFIAVALGWAGIQQVRRSAGAIYGASLAALAFVTPPLMLFNLILLVVVANSLDRLSIGKLQFLIGLILLLWIDSMLIRRWIRKTLAA